MAAEVGSVVREGKGKRDLITRDLLGGCAVLGTKKDLDLDLHVPKGWERRLDLLTGKMYVEKAGSGPVHRELQDLNLLPEDSAALDLKLVSPVSSASPSGYQSVCTLEKVKSALERAALQPRGKPARWPDASSTSPSSSTTSSSVKRRAAEDDGGETVSEPAAAAMVAAGCPSCLLYVLVSRANPRCPRCDSHVPLPAGGKKPRIDLNAA